MIPGVKEEVDVLGSQSLMVPTVSFFPHLHTPLRPFFSSLISLMVSVDPKHYVYLLWT